MHGYKLTAQEAQQIAGCFFNSTTTFNPVEDVNGDYFIFEGEAGTHITNLQFTWVNTMPFVEFIAKPLN